MAFFVPWPAAAADCNKFHPCAAGFFDADLHLQNSLLQPQVSGHMKLFKGKVIVPSESTPVISSDRPDADLVTQTFAALQFQTDAQAGGIMRQPSIRLGGAHQVQPKASTALSTLI